MHILVVVCTRIKQKPHTYTHTYLMSILHIAHDSQLTLFILFDGWIVWISIIICFAHSNPMRIRISGMYMLRTIINRSGSMVTLCGMDLDFTYKYTYLCFNNCVSRVGGNNIFINYNIDMHRRFEQTQTATIGTPLPFAAPEPPEPCVFTRLSWLDPAAS